MSNLNEQLDTRYNDTPLFSTRVAIVEQSEAWCIEKNIPISPYNVITAAFTLGLIKAS